MVAHFNFEVISNRIGLSNSQPAGGMCHMLAMPIPGLAKGGKVVTPM